MANSSGPVLSFSSEESQCGWKQLCGEAFSSRRCFSTCLCAHVCMCVFGEKGIPLASGHMCVPLAFWLFWQLWTPGNTLPRRYLGSFLWSFSMHNIHIYHLCTVHRPSVKQLKNSRTLILCSWAILQHHWEDEIIICSRKIPEQVEYF